MCTENSYLKVMDLSNNGIASKGLKHICNAIQSVRRGFAQL